MSPRPSPHAITASVVVTATLKVCRVMDRGNAKRTRVYSFPLTAEGIGSRSLHELPVELHQLGAEIVAKVKTWEGGPKTAGRPVVDILERQAAQSAAAEMSPIAKLIHEAAKPSA